MTRLDNLKLARKNLFSALQEQKELKKQEWNNDVEFLLRIEPNKNNIPDGSKSWNEQKRIIWKRENRGDLYEYLDVAERNVNLAQLELNLLLDERRDYEFDILEHQGE